MDLKENKINFLGKKKQEEKPKFNEVHGTQQLDRSSIEKMTSKRFMNPASVAIGILVFILTWSFYSVIIMGADNIMNGDVKDKPYAMTVYEHPESKDKILGYYELNRDGKPVKNSLGHEILYDDWKKIKKPDWYKKAKNMDKKSYYFLKFSFFKLIISLTLGAIAGGLARLRIARIIDTQNADKDITILNQWENDRHIELLSDMLKRYSLFPDVGCHSSVSPTAIISHIAIKNTKKLKMLNIPERYKEDVFEDGECIFNKGDIILDDDDEPIMKKAKVFDEAFMDTLFKSVNTKVEDRVYYDSSDIDYNKEKSRDKLKYDTLTDLINNDWHLPLYEPQRPGGAYLVDTSPSNTMVIAITRAGKGQRYIEPMVDVLLREDAENNIILNDPKGELLVKFYVRATIRGYEVVQFNLMFPLNTDIYNPLALAADSARNGDFIGCSTYVSDIADVFFPKDGGEDPLWPTAANNALCDTLKIAS